ncbi:MAG: hypothetical protein K5821_05475 [Nitrobacter sp.]|uniref:hypothetical protein n=1 Tax=Nitrobacter sp. TaxID=29420 RepID=UPI002628667B|nr:hypothetical protein [Nitrobacter sp.]MCV0385868.1 hypothetical protein [Nitrobacter sp.]
MIEIAGGIVLAILFLALLPAILAGAYLVFVAGVVLMGIIAAASVLWVGAQSPEGLAVELILGGIFLLWLHYEIKARRQIAAEEAAKEFRPPDLGG